MATEQKGEGSGLLLSAIIIVGAGIWWWNSRDTGSPPPVFVPTAAAASRPATHAVPRSTQPQLPAVSPHRYDFVEGDLYGYIAAVSEDERKAGKSAGDVIMFRYAGYEDGEYRLETVDDAGKTIGVSTCTKPCVAIKSNYGGILKRVAYSPGSIIGGAMDDAMTGQLKRGRVRRVGATPVPSKQDEEVAIGGAPKGEADLQPNPATTVPTR